MKLKSYLKDKIGYVIFFFSVVILFTLFLNAFRVPLSLMIAFWFIFLAFGIITFFLSFLQRKLFYDQFLNSLKELDQKYLIQELITNPNFLEGRILMETLYEIDKSMKEHINRFETSLLEFKEYIEMWIHEVKIPLANLNLMIHNEKNPDYKMLEQAKKMEEFVEQVLYFARCENSSKDYLIKKNSLSKIVNEVIVKNKESFILNNVKMEIENLDHFVYTDAKWMQYIIGQIVQNSLKYRKNKNATIKISSFEQKEKIILNIWDNGIGILPQEINRVFDKSFTGENGRSISSSTGMGLYLSKTLCNQLGHEILITSESGLWTNVEIRFSKNRFYEVCK